MKTSRISLILFFSSTLLYQPVVSAAVTYTDEIFLDGDWSIVNFEIGGGGSSSAAQELSGGNPGSDRQVTTSIPSGSDERRVFGFNFRTGATYSPQVQGAIADIDYSEDAIIISGAQTVGMAIRQDGKLYASEVISTFTGSNWTEVGAVLDALSYGLFDSGDFDPNQHPDFSSSASELEFGFIRGRGTPGGAPAGATAIGGIDNWSVAVNPVPLPAALWLLGSGMVGLIGLGLRSKPGMGTLSKGSAMEGRAD